MNLAVVDTDVVSYLLKGHPTAARYRPHMEGRTLLISFMTVAELYEGAARDAWGPRRIARLESALRHFIVIPSSLRLARTWAGVRTERRHQPISVSDAWMAATALTRACPLITNNGADFGGISGLTVITEPGP